MTASLAFGVTAGTRDNVRLGAALERIGFDEVWTNDTRRGDGLATLAQLGEGGRNLRLAVGVIALSDHDPASIVKRVAAAGLPPDRFTLGVGSGASRSLAVVRDGVAALREAHPGPIAVAAVGPRMLGLAGEIADAVVVNWALPHRIAWSRERIGEGAENAKRARPRLVAYVRTAIGEDAESRLRAEMDRYGRYALHYARAFAEQPDMPVGVAARTGEQLRGALEPYAAVTDTLVVRGLPRDDGVDAWIAVAAAANGLG